MKLLYFKYQNQSIDHPLNGFEQDFRSLNFIRQGLNPICLAGINGSGKSKLLECLAEVFNYLHGVYDTFLREVEKSNLAFEISYLVRQKDQWHYVNIEQESIRSGPKVLIGKTIDQAHIEENYNRIRAHMPIVVGYTSGENESLSRWFTPYSDTYAEFYQQEALERRKRNIQLPDLPAFLWLDFSMNKKVFVASAVFGDEKALARDSRESWGKVYALI